MVTQIHHALEPVTNEQLATFEAGLGVALPEAYRSFLLQHNGGIPRPSWFRAPEMGEVNWLLSFGRKGILDPRRLDLESCTARMRAPGSTLPVHLVPVAEVWTVSNPGCLPDYLCISTQGADCGYVYFWRDIGLERYRLKAPLKAADSWDSFIAGLYHRDGEPPAWVTLIQDGDLDGLKRLLAKGGSLKKWSQSQETPLDHAISEGRWEILQWLIECGVSATSAFESALDHRRYPLARRLLSCGVKSQAIQQALTAPWRQFFWQDLELVRALIDAGADVNHVDKKISDRYAPLHFAAEVGATEAVRLLLEHGARPDVKNGDGRSPQDLAEKAGHAEVSALLAAQRDKPPRRESRSAPVAPVQELNLNGVQIGRSGPTLTEAGLAALETKFGIRLPADYRAFLLQYNGGVPRPGTFRYAVEDADDGSREFAKAVLTQFHAATGSHSAAGPASLESAYEPSSEWAAPARLVPIADVGDELSGGVLYISVDGKDCGQVYYGPDEEGIPETFHEVAPSFQAFLSLLGKDEVVQP